MKIFISGIGGFLGSNLADRFIEKGHTVVGCDTLVGGYEDNIPKDATFYNADCTDFKTMQKITKDVDVVYHTAALAYEGLSVFSPSIISNSIYQSTVTLLSASISNGIKRFVNTSSMARYGAIEYPFHEKQVCKPQDPYGIAKLASESVVENLCDVHGIEWVTAIPHNIIGPRQKYDDPFRNVASIMINRMMQGKRPIIYGDGKQVRCFSFVEDCIDVLEKMATADCSGERFNIGPDKGFISINELVTKLSKTMGTEHLTPIYMKDRPQEVKVAYCSSDKIREWFDFKQNTSLDAGLQSMIDYIKKRGYKDFDYHLDLEIEKGAPKTWSKKLL